MAAEASPAGAPGLLAVGAEVAAAYGLGELLSFEPGGAGAMGRIWRLRTAGEDVAVKQLYWTTAADDLDRIAVREVAFVELARAAGVQAPRQRVDRTGRFAADTSIGAVRVADWVTGTPVGPHEPDALRWAGATMATLTALPFPAAAPGTEAELDPWYTTAPTEERWSALAAAATRTGAPWAAELSRQVPALLDLADLVGVSLEEPLAWCHTDLQAQNAVRRPDGELELIDWDEAGPVQPRWALARMITDWTVEPGPEKDQVHADRVAVLLQGYRAAGGQTEPSRLTDFGGLIAGTLNFLAGQTELALGIGDPEDLLSTGAHQVQRLLARPLRISTLEKVLDAIVP